ncbi:AMP-binding protein [Halalkalirubrum salinum]|uniref:AMP-binding protein n=1 Tax=Halalkalirubrum salinum TaxID=2563889 RepID=UPI0010FB0925|nr:AMP-binding protein [Halalkalirubrum salinum]
METLPDLLARERRSPTAAVRFLATDREMSYRDFITTAYKSANVLRYLGVSEGATVAIDPRPAPEALLAFFGAAQLSAVATFDLASSSPRVVLSHVDREADFDVEPGTRLAVYNGPPTDSATTHWEAEVWSENPATPPSDATPDTPVLVGEDSTYTHGALLSAASDVVDTLELTADETLAVLTPFSDPRTIAAGAIAALSVGATAVFVGDRQAVDDVDRATLERSDAIIADPNSDHPTFGIDRAYDISDSPLNS